MEIVPYPHPALRFKSQPVREIDAALRKIVDEMFALMYASKGIGLAANQVALPIRLFVLNLSADPQEKDQEQVFINPVLGKRRGTVEGEEGCLSFPGLYGDVKRYADIAVEAFNIQGQPFQQRLTGLAARAVQHESDHLDGVLFIDRMTDGARDPLTLPVLKLEEQFRLDQAAGRWPSDEALRQQWGEPK